MSRSPQPVPEGSLPDEPDPLTALAQLDDRPRAPSCRP